MSIAKNVAKVLLEVNAVKLSPKSPFTFVSGIKSPIYCDNRQVIGFPEGRTTVVEGFIEVLKDMEYDIIAGTATAGIPWSAFIADRLNKPMSYIRSQKKEHGAGKQIEGADVKGKKVIVIEDLISTGGSSFVAVEAAREAGAEVIGVLAIFTYEFEKAKKTFEDGNCQLLSLSNFTTLVNVASENGYIEKEDISMILDWNKDTKAWAEKYNF